MSTPVPPILPPTTFPTTFPTTLPTSGAEPIVVTPGQLLASIALCAFVALAGLSIARACGWWRGDVRWSPTRCPTVAESVPLWLGIGVMVLVGFIAVPSAIAGLGLAGWPPPGAPRTIDDDARQMAAIAVTYVASLIAVAGVHAVGHGRGTLVRLGLAQDLPRARDGALVVLVALPILIALTNLAMIVAQLAWSLLHYQHSSAHALLQLMERAEVRPGVLVLAIVNAVVLAPVFEEVFFRGHLQTALTSLFPRRWPAIAITSLLFAGMHEAWTIPAIFVLSLIVGYVYERTGNLWVAIALHVGFNGASTALFLMTRSQ